MVSDFRKRHRSGPGQETNEWRSAPAILKRNAAAVNGSVLLALLSTAWLLSTHNNIFSEFSAPDRKIIFSFCAIIVALQVTTIFGMRILFRSAYPSIAMSALFVVVNAFSLNLILNAQFMALADWIIALSAGAGLFICFIVIQAMTESRTLRRVALLVASTFAAWTTVAHLTTGAEAFQTTAAKAPQIHGRTNNPSEVVRNVEFVRKPNVYFIGFESMAPQAVLVKYLGLERSPLAETFQRHGFRRFRNMFSEEVPTKASFNSLLALDAPYARVAAQGGYGLFSGNMPSPLLQIFKHNGYETHTLYYFSYLGHRAGPHVDHYWVNEQFSVCTFMEPYEVAYAFFGACRFKDHALWRIPPRMEGKPIDWLLAGLEKITARERPQFLVAHVAPPWHTPKDFTGTPAEIEKFREDYLEYAEEAAHNLDRIVAFLREHDPNSILFVFGDHGIFLSLRVKFEEDRTFFVQDRYGVQGGVYPGNACASSFDEPISRQYVTTPEVARMIIRCLAGGVDAFDPEYRHKLRIAPNEGFESYLYE